MLTPCKSRKSFYSNTIDLRKWTARLKSAQKYNLEKHYVNSVASAVKIDSNVKITPLKIFKFGLIPDKC